MIFRFVSTPLLLCLASVMLAQSPDPAGDHETGHEHHQSEIGFGNSVVYFVNAREWAYSIHLHYTHHIPGAPLEAGLGYERIFSKPAAHNAITL